MLEGPIHQEDVTIVNGCTPNHRDANRRAKHGRDRKEKQKSTIPVGDFNIPLSKGVRKSRQKISEDVENQQDLINIYTTLPNSSRIHILFKCP